MIQEQLNVEIMNKQMCCECTVNSEFVVNKSGSSALELSKDHKLKLFTILLSSNHSATPISLTALAPPQWTHQHPPAS